MMNRDYLDDFVCGPTCEEYYDRIWFDDEEEYSREKNKDSIGLNSWNNWQKDFLTFFKKNVII